MSEPRVVCLIGIDGAGKTAHAHKILAALRSGGKTCKYQWLGSPTFFSFPLMALCRVLGYTEIHNLPGKKIYAEHHYERNKAITEIWPWIRLVDLMIFNILGVYIALWQGLTVVCDRSVHDTLVDIMVDTKTTDLDKRLVGRLILRFNPRSARTFLLDVDEATAFRRKEDIPHPRYLSLRRKNYLSIAAALCIPVIDTQQPFAAVNKKLVKLLKSKNSAVQSLSLQEG